MDKICFDALISSCSHVELIGKMLFCGDVKYTRMLDLPPHIASSAAMCGNIHYHGMPAGYKFGVISPAKDRIITSEDAREMSLLNPFIVFALWNGASMTALTFYNRLCLGQFHIDYLIDYRGVYLNMINRSASGDVSDDSGLVVYW